MVLGCGIIYWPCFSRLSPLSAANSIPICCYDDDDDHDSCRLVSRMEFCAAAELMFDDWINDYGRCASLYMGGAADCRGAR